MFWDGHFYCHFANCWKLVLSSAAVVFDLSLWKKKALNSIFTDIYLESIESFEYTGPELSSQGFFPFWTNIFCSKIGK